MATAVDMHKWWQLVDTCILSNLVQFTADLLQFTAVRTTYDLSKYWEVYKETSITIHISYNLLKGFKKSDIYWKLSTAAVAFFSLCPTS